MMLDLSDAPQAVRNFADWLSDRGTSLSLQAFDSPNNQLLRAPSPRGTVQLLADRGQWFVELAPPGADEFFDTAVWSSCLAGGEVSLELTPLDTQVEWLQEFLAGELREGPTIDCLREAQRKRAYGRLGLEW
jgi:hypothetical protein